MSFYADYIRERTSDSIIETEHGFATYRYLDAQTVLDAKTVYIIDIYVRPDARNARHASHLADRIAELAHGKGCTKMLGTVVPSTKGATASLRVLLAYGMTLKSAGENLIIMEKGI